MTRHCACSAQLQPHEWLMEVCPFLVSMLPPITSERVAVEFPVGYDWHPSHNLLVDPDLEDDRVPGRGDNRD